jgi:hypothetical protein
MNYIKISKLNKLIKYPYTWNDIYEENPFTLYDDRFTLAQWYEQTEEGSSSGNKILEVTIQDSSSVDHSKFTVTYDSTPVFENNQWILKYTTTDIIIDTTVSSTTSSTK